MNVFNRLKQVATVSTVALCISVAAMNQATAAERYIVSGVESWDTLNIRSEPNSGSTIIGEIPANGSGVNSSGQTVQTGRSTWIKVNWNGVNGWVSKRYLATDYTYTAPKPAPVTVTTPAYIKTPDYSTQVTQRTGSIYDSGTGTVRSVYVGPGNGLPAIKAKQQPAPYTPPVAAVNTANTHSHPANRCTRSVSHTHPNGANQHTHRYSCQGQATQQQRPQVQVRAATQTSANTHTHPRNQFTNAVTHTHASGSSQHKHNYGGQQRQVQQQPQVQVRAPASANTHTHPRNQFTNAVTHTHASGSSQHKHNYGGQQQRQVQQQPQVQVRAPASANTHTHPRNQFTNAVTHTHASGSAQHKHNYGGQQRQVQQQPTVQQMRQVAATASQLVTHIHPASPYNKQTQHTHAGGAGAHVHDFLLPPRQAVAAPVAQNAANMHRHPANNLTKSVMHSHPNGANQHNHSYGGQR